MHPLSFLLSCPCPLHYCLHNPKESQASYRAGLFISPSKKLWVEVVTGPSAVLDGSIPWDHPSRDCSQAMQYSRAGHWTLLMASRSSRVPHFRAKSFSEVYFPLSLSLPTSLHSCQTSIVTWGWPLSSPGLWSNNCFTFLVPSDTHSSEYWAVKVITRIHQKKKKRQVQSKVWGMTHYVTKGSHLEQGVGDRGSWWPIC